MATVVAPSEAIVEVWQQYKAGTDRDNLRNRLVEYYLPLVRYNGERIWARLPDGVELDDLAFTDPIHTGLQGAVTGRWA